MAVAHTYLLHRSGDNARKRERFHRRRQQAGNAGSRPFLRYGTALTRTMVQYRDARGCCSAWNHGGGRCLGTPRVDHGDHGGRLTLLQRSGNTAFSSHGGESQGGQLQLPVAHANGPVRLCHRFSHAGENVHRWCNCIAKLFSTLLLIGAVDYPRIEGRCVSHWCCNGGLSFMPSVLRAVFDELPRFSRFCNTQRDCRDSAIAAAVGCTYGYSIPSGNAAALTFNQPDGRGDSRRFQAISPLYPR